MLFMRFVLAQESPDCSTSPSPPPPFSCAARHFAPPLPEIPMTPLKTILADLPAEDARRIEAALALMNRQAIGSERYREDAKCWTKEDKSPVTIADLLHQSQVQQMLHDAFRGDGLIGEEPRSMQEQVVAEAAEISGRFYGSPLRPELIDVPERGEVTWILDPIDGTKGYLKGRYYAIALGYFRGSEPVFGAMAVPHAPQAETAPIDNAIAFAVKGRGAWMGFAREDGALDFAPLRTQQAGYAKPYRVAVSLEHAGALGAAVEGGAFVPVKLDSQAKYLAVAANHLDAYARASRDDGGKDVSWDHVPGALIAMEAGCTVCHFDGTPVQFAPEPVVRFKGGMLCHRGPAGSDLAAALRELVNAR
jgi:3'-phosphoadenosine 5'-phosphosulfate (PAPS) 3'-phosphatase